MSIHGVNGQQTHVTTPIASEHEVSFSKALVLAVSDFSSQLMSKNMFDQAEKS
jgi:hypothetical protein